MAKKTASAESESGPPKKKKQRTADVDSSLLYKRSEELGGIAEACEILSKIMVEEKVKPFKDVDGTNGYITSRKQIRKWLQRVYELINERPGLSSAIKERLAKVAVSLFAT